MNDRIVGMIGVQGLKIYRPIEDINCRDTWDEVSTDSDLLAIQSYKADDNQVTKKSIPRCPALLNSSHGTSVVLAIKTKV